jgi:hypothetical protein
VAADGAKTPRKAIAVLSSMAAISIGLMLAADASGKAFGAHISCGSPFRDADRACVGGDQPYAVFRAARRSFVNYRLCVRAPSGFRNCRPQRTGRRGRFDAVPIAAGQVGRYTVVWRVRGRLIDRDHYFLRAENARPSRRLGTKTQPRARARIRFCGDLPGANSYDIRTRRLRCGTARTIVRQYDRKAMQGDFSIWVRRFYCRTESLYGDGANVLCGRGHGYRQIRFARGG